ncbi:MAG: hypothetical protein QOF43_921 [Gaiellaceae bacterium]|nr:hypothetical protein [Gaiellaceae bacterium]
MVERKDVEAALAARHELGREYEPEIIEAFLERIEGRLEPKGPGRPAPRQRREGSITPLALGSIGAGVGSTAIATIHHQGWVAVIAWLAIAIINLGYARAWRR